jgi:probable HAF family extracellular repeat protein
VKSRTWPCIIAMTLIATLAIPVRLAAQAHNQHQPRYTITDLGTLGGTFSQAFGINNNGFVVGFATLSGDTALHAFLWRKGMMTDLSTLAPADTLPISVAFSINDKDEIVGMSETSVPDPLGEDFCGFGDHLICLPFLRRASVMNPLPTLGGNNGQASAVNNRGQVVGVAETDKTDPTCQNPVVKPAIWEKGEVHALPTAPFRDGIVGGGPGPAENNDKGQVVYVAVTCDFSATRTLLWHNNRVTDMGTFEGLSLTPTSINNKGQATGTYTTNTGLNRGFLWQDGVAIDLGSLPDHPQVHGNSIDDRGQIAGQTCVLDQSSCTVFLWQNGAMTDLNDVVPADSSLYMFDPSTINSVGEIVGLAIDKNSGACCHGFLAIPDNSAVAESATATLQGQLTPRPNIVLPENVRRALQQWLGKRYHIPGLGASPRD